MEDSRSKSPRVEIELNLHKDSEISTRRSRCSDFDSIFLSNVDRNLSIESLYDPYVFHMELCRR